MNDQVLLKKKAAERAVEFIESGMIVGLGTGSTTRFALEFLGQEIKRGQLQDIVGIPSSLETEDLANKLDIPLTTLERHQKIDVTIDGADEVDPHLNLIKGGGGALLREKILAQVSRRNIIIVDDTKLSPQLGTRWPIPVEVIPFARTTVAAYLESRGASVQLRKRGTEKLFTTDQGNVVLDAHFGPLPDLEKLSFDLNQRAGLVEHGLFIGLATDVIVADKIGIRHLKR